MLLVIVATFCGSPTSTWHAEVAERGLTAWVAASPADVRGPRRSHSRRHDALHPRADAVRVGHRADARARGHHVLSAAARTAAVILPTVIAVTAVVAIASGMLGGVSMIGLTIRTFVIILMLGAAPIAAVRYAVMVCTAVTTICGVWTAYGEPPNLIMKANLFPQPRQRVLPRTTGPVAVASFVAIAWQLRGAARRTCHVDLDNMDVLDANAEGRPVSSGLAARRGDDAGGARSRDIARTSATSRRNGSWSGCARASRSASR